MSGLTSLRVGDSGFNCKQSNVVNKILKNIQGN